MKNIYHEMIKKAEETSPAELSAAYPHVSAAEIQALTLAVNRTMPEILQESGKSGREVCRRFGISYRTMEDWTNGRRTCPVYLRLMIQELLGMYHPPKFD